MLKNIAIGALGGTICMNCKYPTIQNLIFLAYWAGTMKSREILENDRFLYIAKCLRVIS